MEVLCFDIGSGGVAAARFDERLQVVSAGEVPWDLQANLPSDAIESALLQLGHRLQGERPAAVCISSFMHSFLVLSSCCAPLTTVSTWMDNAASSGVDTVRQHIGTTFHTRTGCHYHPMFPIFKLVANPPGRGNRVASPKSWLAWELTGEFVDDFGIAAASGMLNARSGTWDPDLLNLAGIDPLDLPRIVNPDVPIGVVQAHAVSRFGIPAGTTLVAGSGDGFLANVGSGCTTPQRMAITLGTSGVARQMVQAPALNPEAGTFCYRASSNAFLLGCASNNGGNALDWARTEFGPLDVFSGDSRDLPIFMPWVHGERSLEWNPDLKPVWHGRKSHHSPAELARAVAEGVLFNLAQYVEVVESQSGVTANEIILSGNGFLDPVLPSLLATVLGRELLQPQNSGLATLRGAAVYAWLALGHAATPALERNLVEAVVVKPATDSSLDERFARFKQLR